MAEIKSTEDQNLQSEATVNSVSKIPILNSSDDCEENEKNCEQNLAESKSTEEQNFQSEAVVSLVSKIPTSILAMPLQSVIQAVTQTLTQNMMMQVVVGLIDNLAKNCLVCLVK
ncbi:MAG: hypothetical protein DMENIID0002_07120 [Rickettsia endosymbiont of Sergentomyia squamirostris]|uniref:Uncharacterized protein n=1 Tax=Candidatus Tisiphia endosymbiont of Sergentomyia squamirostris TaxID=3113639 RepID=A0AAT9G8B9_9RICK